MSFARNEATRYISPTKTPEYLAAGRVAVTTSIRDVVATYGARGLVDIADDVPATAAAFRRAGATARSDRLQRADAFLQTMSWDRTWQRMVERMAIAASKRSWRRTSVMAASTAVSPAPVASLAASPIGGE